MKRRGGEELAHTCTPNPATRRLPLNYSVISIYKMPPKQGRCVVQLVPPLPPFAFKVLAVLQVAEGGQGVWLVCVWEGVRGVQVVLVGREGAETWAKMMLVFCDHFRLRAATVCCQLQLVSAGCTTSSPVLAQTEPRCNSFLLPPARCSYISRDEKETVQTAD